MASSASALNANTVCGPHELDAQMPILCGSLLPCFPPRPPPPTGCYSGNKSPRIEDDDVSVETDISARTPPLGETKSFVRDAKTSLHMRVM